MKIGTLKMPLAATTMLLALGTTADAQDVIVCESLTGLNEIMVYMTFTNEDKDRPALQAKLDEAQEKIDQSKVCDAGLKVSDFNYKVFRLDSARKTKVGESLPGAVQCALEGSEALAETWRTGCDAVSEPPRGKGRKKD